MQFCEAMAGHALQTYYLLNRKLLFSQEIIVYIRETDTCLDAMAGHAVHVSVSLM
jgi:hypothetical protein